MVGRNLLRDREDTLIGDVEQWEVKDGGGSEVLLRKTCFSIVKRIL